MKKISLLFFILFFSSCSTTRVLISYKGDNLVKEYKVVENKNVKRSFSNLFPMYEVCKKADIKKGQKPPNSYACWFFVTIPIDIVTLPFLLIYDFIVPSETSYSYNTHANIEGILTDKNQKPLDNQKILIGFNAETETTYSNKNGVFKTHLSKDFANYKNKQSYSPDTIMLNFNEGIDISSLNKDLRIGKDLSINNPNEIFYTYPFDNINGTFVYLEDQNINKKEMSLGQTTDTIILSTETFSAQYYRTKLIEKEKEINIAIEQAKEMFRKAGLQIAAETIILDENKNLKKDWNNIINAIISANKMLKKTGLQIAVETIILDEEENLKSNWKEVVQQEINKENKIKRKRRIVEYPDSCNLTYKDEDEIFDAVGYTTDLRGTITSLMEVPDGRWISSPVQIMQVIGNKKFLFTLGNGQFVFYGILKNCCRNTNFYDGEWVDIAATIEGTFTYTTVLYGTKTVPKVKVYAIRPSIVIQKRYY